ncbi:hypothetical protein MNBD_ACTINO02-3009 [hydrothermal vent metagenome]|uniref:Uncharacterized protein n=1 Tax=hydrothermal vent metagenome TaxID=652676 RepID=A0A3B0T271_9ZZZZ
MKRLAVVSAFLLLVAACGGTTNDPTAPVAGTNASDTTSPATTGDGTLEMSDFIPGFDPDQFETIDFRAQELKVQQSVAACMAAEGFEYIPYVQSGIGGGFESADFQGEEFAKEYGLGISTFILQEQGQDQAAEDFENQDPNQPIVDAMSEAERQEYQRLLYGGGPPIVEDTPQEVLEAMTPDEREQFYDDAFSNWEPDGCFYQAQTEAFDVGAANAFYDEFGERLSDLYMRVESDPRIVAANKQWTVCMTEKGQSFADQEEMYRYFDAKVNELMGWSPEPEGDRVSGTTVVEFESEGGESGERYDKEALQALMEEEITVAVANFECSADMQKTFEAVYKDLERRFVNENLAELQRFKDENS